MVNMYVERRQRPPRPPIHPCQRTYSVFTNTHISTAVCTYCPYMPLANGDRDHFCFSSLPLPLSLPLSLSLSLCIFLFIFTALFEVVITLHVSFDALMNRLFACDALENGNYDSLSLSPTFLCTLSPVALLPRPHFHLLLFSSPRPIILFFLFVFFLLQIIVSLKYCLPRDLCLRLVFPLSPTHSFFLYISLSSLFLTLLLYILFIILFAQMLSQVPHCYGCRFVRVVFVFLTVSDPCEKMCKMSHHVYHCMCESWS